jgi:hypothetical protein
MQAPEGGGDRGKDTEAVNHKHAADKLAVILKETFLIFRCWLLCHFHLPQGDFPIVQQSRK